jgi:Tol biopolymer transport system component
VTLMVEDLASGSLTQIASGGARPVGKPSWDPSGQRLSFVRYAKLGSESALFGFGDTVMEVNPDGSCPTAVLHTPGVAYLAPAWQPGTGREAGPIAC